MKTITNDLKQLVKNHLIVLEDAAYRLDDSAGDIYTKDFLDIIKKSADKKEQYVKPEDTLLEFISKKTMHPNFFKGENKLIETLIETGYEKLLTKIVDLAKDIPIFEGGTKTKRDAREVLVKDTELLSSLAKNSDASHILYLAKVVFGSNQTQKERADFIFGKGGDESALGIFLKNEHLCNFKKYSTNSNEIDRDFKLIKFSKGSRNLAYYLVDFAKVLNAEDKLMGITKRTFTAPKDYYSDSQDFVPDIKNSMVRGSVKKMNALFDKIENIVSKHEKEAAKNIQKNVMERDDGLSFFGISGKSIIRFLGMNK